MSRMIWKGAISFGLVHVPVQLFPATRSEKVSFHLLDKRSMDPVGYRQINKRTGKDVPREQIVRGYEYEKEKYVVLSEDEIRAANPESTQTVDILAFVDAPAISFLYLETPYFLAPDRKGEKVYALLREALKASGKIGVASVVMHNKQHLAALVPFGPVLALNTLRWADEIRPVSELTLPPEDAKKAGVTARELDMAKKLIDDMSEDWDPEHYHDTFRDDVLELVDRKIREGKTEEIETPEEPQPRRSADILDLSELLRRSLGRGKGRASGRADRDEDPDDDPSGSEASEDGKRGKSRSRARDDDGARTTNRTTARGSHTAARGTGRSSETTRKETPHRKRHAA
ncbi:Ku protein [Paraburkholderia kururiensis]|uniref:Non-homologous end joining protein Ku n=1 Tax=Paraburkholderia kururiensis TaxID=984307 RepID=A0ABZ0WU75_9BURK|nr:Ku protein [Paraburkholderia kururiensis]WQD80970.1 Ku protein [Paraburkholderia kururiensis]